MKKRTKNKPPKRLAAKSKAVQTRHQMPLVRARFSASSGGFGFATPLDEKQKANGDIFIPPKFTGDAIDGDIVSVRLLDDDEVRGDHPGATGKVEEILDRGRKFVVAQLNGKRTARPLDRHLPEELKVNTLPKSAKVGDWVKLRLLDTGSKHTEQLRAEAVERIGKAGDVNADLDAVMTEFDLQPPYTEKQNVEAEKLEPVSIPRKSMTRAFTVTIDPTDAHDFDDAISIGKGKNDDELELGVHIADVAAFIRPGSFFDKEAGKRGFSSYLPGRFLPMLPKKLTAKISLRENVDSPAHTVLFTVRKSDSMILQVQRFHSTVRINKRLDYKTVQEFLNDPKSAPKDWTVSLKRNLRLLTDLIRKMRENRRKREQFLDIPLPEIRVCCDETTCEVTGIERKMPCEADTLVEECMLAANSAVAEELISKHLPGLYRIHPEPDPDKIDDFCTICTDAFHFSPGDILASRTACTHFLASIPDDTRKPVILSLFLRSLPRASYQAGPDLHYGLGKEKYSHFTSPIRRYTDLCLHQQLWSMDVNERTKSVKKMESIAELCTQLEENNDNAYFAANDRLKIHYLKQIGALDNGTMFEAVITKIKSAGIVCMIDELGLQGFIPRENLRGGSYHRSDKKRQRMVASKGRNSYKIGDFIYVTIDTIDLVRGTVQFRPSI